MRRIVFRKSPSEYDEDFMEAMASQYLERTPWSQLRLAALHDLVEPAAGDRIIDLGCAAGALTHYLSGYGATVVGVDAEERAIAKARSLFPDMEFRQSDVAAMPFGADSFDKAVAGDLVEHLDAAKFRAMLRELERVLVPGGSVSIYTPNPLHLIERLKARNLIMAQNPTHIGLRTSSELIETLQDCGFTVDHASWRASFFPVLRPVEAVLGRYSQTFRYRLCLHARTTGSSSALRSSASTVAPVTGQL